MEVRCYEIMNRIEKSYWWSRGRRRIVKNIIKGPNPKILDIGCGSGALLEELTKIGDAVGVDSSSLAIEFCREKNLQVKMGDATKLPFLDKTFDYVLSLDVLEHIEDDGKAVSEMKRVLKDSGSAIIMVPMFNWLWCKADKTAHHFRRYNKKRLCELMDSNNLLVTRFTYFNTLLFLPIMLIKKIINPVSEVDIKLGFLNQILHIIYSFETTLLRYVNFPLGVSSLIIARKNSE